jgi:hypothetical protein
VVFCVLDAPVLIGSRPRLFLADIWHIDPFSLGSRLYVQPVVPHLRPRLVASLREQETLEDLEDVALFFSS